METLGPPELAFMGFLGVFLLSMGFWFWMLIDCIQHEPEEKNSKIKWVIIICVASAPGAVAYFFLKRCKRV